jgi:hypothetical protein
MPIRHDSRNEETVKATQRQKQEGDLSAGGAADASGLLSALGNARVQHLMRSSGLHRMADGSGALDDAVAQQIQAKRGGGQPLDESVRRNLEPALGGDFADVRVHTDDEADALNHAVHSEAFTTGMDIFFRSGKYSPASSNGQKLLAHELTHVVQQRSAPPADELRVSSPDDSSEREAAEVADSVSSDAQPAASVSRQAEEEEELQMSSLDRQEAEEEEVQA